MAVLVGFLPNTWETQWLKNLGFLLILASSQRQMIWLQPKQVQRMNFFVSHPSKFSPPTFGENGWWSGGAYLNTGWHTVGLVSSDQCIKFTYINVALRFVRHPSSAVPKLLFREVVSQCLGSLQHCSFSEIQPHYFIKSVIVFPSNNRIYLPLSMMMCVNHNTKKQPSQKACQRYRIPILFWCFALGTGLVRPGSALLASMSVAGVENLQQVARIFHLAQILMVCAHQKEV